ncbi:MAG: CHAT domain-containing protein [Marinilabiliaceae bacterium]|nr:CHAT domain-containing protein [Marinilabiliaceae bacterium]
MRRVIFITLVLCTLTTHCYCENNQDNFIKLIRLYNTGNYELLIENHKEIPATNYSTRESMILFSTLIKAYAQLGKYDEAVEFINSVKSNESFDLAVNIIQFYKATFFLNFNKYNISKTIFHEILKKDSLNPLPDSIKTKVYHNLAICYKNENNSQKALFYYKLSYEIEKELLAQSKNYENFNITAGSIIQTLSLYLKRFEEAEFFNKEVLSYPFNQEISYHNTFLYSILLDHYHKTESQIGYISISQKLEDFHQSQLPKNKNDFGFFYLKLGEKAFFDGHHQKALSHFNKALSLISRSSRYNNKRPAVQSKISRIYEKNDQIELSIAHAKLAIEESKIKGDNKTHFYYTNTARILSKTKQYDQAYRYLDSAIIAYKLNQAPHTNSDKIFINQLAWTYYQLGNFKKALQNFQLIDNLVKNQELYGRYEFWDNSNDMCNCYLNLRDYSKAELLLNTVYNEMNEKYGYILTSHIQSDIKRLFKRINLNYTRTLYAEYLQTGKLCKLQQAFKHLQQADLLIDQVRSGLQFDRDQMATGDSYFDYTKLGMEITTALNKELPGDGYLEKAFTYSQKGKAYSLLLGVNDRKWKIRAGIPEQTIREENNIKGKLKFYQNEFETESRQAQPDTSILNHLNGYVDLYMQKFDSINHHIQSNYPKYYQLKYSPQHITSKELQNNLGENQVLIDYYLTDNKLYQYVFTAEQFLFFNQKIDSTFYKDLKLVTEEVSTPFIGNRKLEEIKQFIASSNHLYSILLGNLSSVIHNRDLIIVPHSDLAYLPFEVLLTQIPVSNKPLFKEFPWLIRQNAISYAYNAALLPDHHSNTTKFNQVLAFAPNYYGNQQLHDSTLLSIKRNINKNLLPLNAARSEVKYISKLFHSDLLLDDEASKANFITHLANNNILHLAMHSLIDDSQPLNSQLVFAARNDSSDILRAYELYNYNIQSPMVVLSSCNTGRGRKKNGEGLISIARAFMFSGAKSQLMTLWPVNDVSGSELTKLFYSGLKDVLTKDHALQNAKLNYIHSSDAIRSHPYYWANYILSGDTSALRQKMPLGWFISLTTFIVFLIFIWIYIRSKKQH